MTTGSIALNPHRWRERVANYGLLVALLVLMVIFSTINPRFFALATLLEQNTALFTLGLAPANDSLPLGIIAGFSVAVLVEVFNALLIVRAGINPLIVTLACWIWRGAWRSASPARNPSPCCSRSARPVCSPCSPSQ